MSGDPSHVHYCALCTCRKFMHSRHDCECAANWHRIESVNSVGAAVSLINGPEDTAAFGGLRVAVDSPIGIVWVDISAHAGCPEVRQ